MIVVVAGAAALSALIRCGGGVWILSGIHQQVDDAKSAAHWLARQPYVDREQILVFGHSVGGGISAVLPFG